jgi:hypothetical protein
MAPQLIASLLKTLGIDPVALQTTADSVATLAQHVAARLDAIDKITALAERRLCLIEARTELIIRMMTARPSDIPRPGKDAQSVANGSGKPPLLDYIETQEAEDGGDKKPDC